MVGIREGRWGLVMGVVLAVMAMGVGEVAALTAAECKAERDMAVKKCLAVVFGRNPSPACCERARVSHAECICPAVTSKLMTYVDPSRAIRLIQSCGRRVPRHFKCGSNQLL
ncbi:uncharacterized protein E5676_scaffold1017G00830 [Cucumis melo var. makuwa]|uniref:Bifunctional inhibitor/plant lipid transfer protein/seed storage helical domain-containing protein n=1 Tax=Cucumis melo var. makuwa TaxID=1194695 RepID=A0A5A7TC47_CUCMM|nr:uncharacterized protein E6C27_scaffold477G00110 [Cucumis melo var. makuwa]TYK12068.1 uncharacterized protein E5676_scaffold1017G00830 [Cucumis melo var. makuwa]